MCGFDTTICKKHHQWYNSDMHRKQKRLNNLTRALSLRKIKNSWMRQNLSEGASKYVTLITKKIVSYAHTIKRFKHVLLTVMCFYGHSYALDVHMDVEEVFASNSLTGTISCAKRRTSSTPEYDIAPAQKRVKELSQIFAPPALAFLRETNYTSEDLVYWQPYNMIIPISTLPALLEAPQWDFVQWQRENAMLAVRRSHDLMEEELRHGQRNFDNALLGEDGGAGVFCFLPSGEKFSAILNAKRRFYSGQYRFPNATHALHIPLCTVLGNQFFEAYTLKPGGWAPTKSSCVFNFWREVPLDSYDERTFFSEVFSEFLRSIFPRKDFSGRDPWPEWRHFNVNLYHSITQEGVYPIKWGLLHNRQSFWQKFFQNNTDHARLFIVVRNVGACEGHVSNQPHEDVFGQNCAQKSLLDERMISQQNSQCTYFGAHTPWFTPRDTVNLRSTDLSQHSRLKGFLPDMT